MERRVEVLLRQLQSSGEVEAVGNMLHPTDDTGPFFYFLGAMSRYVGVALHRGA